MTLFWSQYSIFDSLSVIDIGFGWEYTRTGYLLNDFTFRNSVAPMTSARRENFNYLGHVNRCAMQPISKRDTEKWKQKQIEKRREFHCTEFKNMQQRSYQTREYQINKWKGKRIIKTDKSKEEIQFWTFWDILKTEILEILICLENFEIHLISCN